MRTLTTLAFLFSLTLSAQECSHLWYADMAINPTHPKLMSGDTYAGYGLLGFYNRSRVHLVFQGEFLRGRFMSFESYRTKQKLEDDMILDFEIEPDPGSVNPFRPGMPMEAPNRRYTVHLVPEGTEAPGPNVITYKTAPRVTSVFYRAYVPSSEQLSVADLPKVYAFDSRTGEPTECPRGINTAYDPKIIDKVSLFIPFKEVLEFKSGGFWNGTNHAIPGYVYSLTKVEPGNVAVVRFKAPTHVRTESGTGPFVDEGQTRYWSFCTQHWEDVLTLACLPDYKATPDPEGFVTVVVGESEKVKREALKRGFNYLPERRQPGQELFGYAYRNVWVDPNFEPYVGDYLPTGRICAEVAFLRGDCTP